MDVRWCAVFGNVGNGCTDILRTTCMRPIGAMSRNVQLVKSLMYILLGTRPQPWNKPRRRHQHGRNLVGSLGLERCGYSGATHNPEAGGLEDIRQDRIPLGAE